MQASAAAGAVGEGKRASLEGEGNGTPVDSLLTERAHGVNRYSNQGRCLFDACMIQEMVPDIFSWPGIGLLCLAMIGKNRIERERV